MLVRRWKRKSDLFCNASTSNNYGENNVTSPGRDAAVPMHAQSPGDIAAPVEIDSTTRDGSDMLSPMSSPSLYHTPLSDTIDGRFELYGNDSAITPDRPLSIVPTPPQSIMGDKGTRKD